VCVVLRVVYVVCVGCVLTMIGRLLDRLVLGCSEVLQSGPPVDGMMVLCLLDRPSALDRPSVRRVQKPRKMKSD
jgi:hypothetical protein